MKNKKTRNKRTTIHVETQAQDNNQRVANSKKTINYKNPHVCKNEKPITIKEFKGSNYILPKSIWENFDWTIDKCVLRSDNTPIKR